MQLWHVFTHEDRAPLFRETFFQLCQTLENQLQEIQGQCLGAIPVEYENVSGAMSTLKTKKLGMRFGAGGGGQHEISISWCRHYSRFQCLLELLIIIFKRFVFQKRLRSSLSFCSEPRGLLSVITQRNQLCPGRRSPASNRGIRRIELERRILTGRRWKVSSYSVQTQ